MSEFGIFNQPATPKKSRPKPLASSYPSGDYYGTGFKQPMGKMRGDSVGMSPVPKKALGKPPKSLA